jgi:hypothetical protein
MCYIEHVFDIPLKHADFTHYPLLTAFAPEMSLRELSAGLA